MSPVKIEMRVDGIRRLLQKLSADNPIYAQPWTDALNKATEIMYRAAVQRAPRLTGKLAGTIVQKLQNKPVPLWGRVRFPNKIKPGGKRGKGFRYGGALEGGGKFHYGSGPFTGQQTRGWFRGAKAAAAGVIEPLLARAKAEIENRWAQ